MPYITVQQSPIYYQITLDDILDNVVDLSKVIVPNKSNTRTVYKSYLTPEFLERFDFDTIIKTLDDFNYTYAKLFEAERESLYSTFFIPKKSGGLRKIDAPTDELKGALYRLKSIFETEMFASYHTSAFAYVEGRSTVHSLRRHQQNESKWFAKFDFSNFFGSTTMEFAMSILSEIFPFSEVIKRTNGRTSLERALSLCFLNGGLPQGTPISPMLTNLLMIPIDHKLSNELRKSKSRLVYTRYADDIMISSKVDFKWSDVENYIIEVLRNFNAPFSIKKEKTRYGSSAGRNWNLGLMLNKDNNITIGYRKKKIFKATCYKYINDKKNGINWSIEDVQSFNGSISYYKMVEPDYINYVIEKYNRELNVDLEYLIKEDLKAW